MEVMLVVILIILLVLWIFGYGSAATLPFPVINFMNHTITLWDIFIFLLILWLIGILPTPFRQIASVIFVLWVLSVLGVIAIVGFSSLIVIAMIVGLLVYVLSVV